MINPGLHSRPGYSCIYNISSCYIFLHYYNVGLYKELQSKVCRKTKNGAERRYFYRQKFWVFGSKVATNREKLVTTTRGGSGWLSRAGRVTVGRCSVSGVVLVGCWRYYAMWRSVMRSDGLLRLGMYGYTQHVKTAHRRF